MQGAGVACPGAVLGDLSVPTACVATRWGSCQPKWLPLPHCASLGVASSCARWAFAFCSLHPLVLQLIQAWIHGSGDGPWPGTSTLLLCRGECCYLRWKGGRNTGSPAGTASLRCPRGGASVSTRSAGCFLLGSFTSPLPAFPLVATLLQTYSPPQREAQGSLWAFCSAQAAVSSHAAAAQMFREQILG